MSSPRYSIVTPSVLRHSLVRLCRSIEAQTCASWEHVVMVDLDEVDHAAGIFNEIDHPQRAIFKCDRAHRNYGNSCRHDAYEHLRGDYCIYIDDDDYMADKDVLRDLDKAVKEPWALFPILRHGERSYWDNPVRGCSCSVVAMRWLAEWPDSENYDADGVYIKHLIDSATCHFLPGMRPLVVQPMSGGIGRNSIIRIDGRDWSCRDEEVGGYHWVAVSDNPRMLVTAESWDQLVAEIKRTNPADPRIDGVAVCDPLPEMDAIMSALRAPRKL